MFKILTLVAAVCLALPAGEDGAANAGKGEHAGKRYQELLQRFDADHDGKLSESERAAAKEAVKGRLAEAKAKFDADHDGKLSEAEREAARAALAAKLKEKHPELFAKIDTNGDGQLSKEEMQAARAKLHELRQHHQGGHGERAQK